MANQFAKKDIDFDVYERADPESQIDWGKQAKVISDTFSAIAKDRQDRKAAVEKGWLDYESCLMESLLSLRRAGADMIFTYGAIDAATFLKR